MTSTIRRMVCVLAIALSAALVYAAESSGPVNVSEYKPPIRVACLGDSITFGVGAGAGKAWPDQLDRMLGDGWDVRNFGHSGASVAKGEKHNIWGQKEYRQALLFHPDVVIILLGTNDTKPDNWAFKKDFPKLYSQLVASFQKLSSKPRVYCGYPPYVARKGAFGINEAGVKEQMPMILQVAGELGAGVIDVHGALDGKDELIPDNVHPNADGATAIAKAVYKALAGKEFEGKVPGPQEVKKDKQGIREVENAGEMTYRELFAMIASESGMPSEAMEKIRDKFEVTSPLVEARINDFEDKIKEADSLRMKYKHTKEEAEKPLYGEYRAKVAQLKQEMDKYKKDMARELIAMIPSEYKGAFGAAYVRKFVMDRFAPIGSTLTPEQQKKIREICKARGVAYGNINNAAERDIENAEILKTVYEQVLDPEQKKRVEPQ